MKPIFFKFLIPIFLIILVTGCYPDGPEYTSDYNLVGASRNPNFDFNSARTFVLPDSIVFIQDANDTKTYLTKPQEQEIVNEIRNQLLAMGWTDSTYATVDTVPDVILTVTGIASRNQGAYWDYWGWYGGWGYYPGWGYPGWGWGGGYYPGYGYPVYYEYTTGTLIIDMIDYKNLDSYTDADKSPFVWGGALNGIVNRTPVNVSAIKSAIDKMFELSPYLDKAN